MPATPPARGQQGTLAIDPEALRTARLRRFWSQTDLARASGVSAHGISRLENDSRTARMSTVRALADALGVEPLVLLADPSALTVKPIR